MGRSGVSSNLAKPQMLSVRIIIAKCALIQVAYFLFSKRYQRNVYIYMIISICIYNCI